jgi:hypothetical protein
MAYIQYQIKQEAVCMKGKYYGIYNIKREDECLGIFESRQEISDFFGGIKLNRISCAVVRKNPLMFGKERYWVEVFTEPTKNSVRKMMREKFGLWMYMIKAEGIYTRQDRNDDWHYFAADYEEAVSLCSQ